MKILKTLLVALLILLFCRYSFSQQESVTKKFVYRKDNLTDKEIVNFDTTDIVSIINPSDFANGKNKDNSVSENKRGFFYLGFGYTSKSPSNASHKYFNGYNGNVKYLYTFSKTFGLRFDLDYYYFKRDESSFTTSDFAGVQRTYKYYSGEVNAYLLKTCLVFGNLNPEETINFYFYPAIGFGSASISSRFDTFMEFNGSLTPVYPTSDEKGSSFCIGVSVGTGITVKLSKFLKGFAEFRFNSWHMGSKGPPSFLEANLGIVL